MPAWGKDTITYTGTIVGPNDSCVKPTGSGRVRLKVTEKGMTFMKTGR